MLADARTMNDAGTDPAPWQSTWGKTRRKRVLQACKPTLLTARPLSLGKLDSTRILASVATNVPLAPLPVPLRDAPLIPASIFSSNLYLLGWASAAEALKLEVARKRGAPG